MKFCNIAKRHIYISIYFSYKIIFLLHHTSNIRVNILAPTALERLRGGQKIFGFHFFFAKNREVFFPRENHLMIWRLKLIFNPHSDYFDNIHCMPPSKLQIDIFHSPCPSPTLYYSLDKDQPLMCSWIFHPFCLTFIEEIMFRTSIERFCHVFERSNSLFISNDVIFLREISSIIRPFMAYFLRKKIFLRKVNGSTRCRT